MAGHGRRGDQGRVRRAGLPNATFKDEYVPESWQRAGQSTLYRTVVATSCRTCHLMRGVVGNSDQDFTTYEKFQSFSDRIKAHVIDRGNMPLVKLIFDRFWGDQLREHTGPTSSREQGFTVKDAGGAVLMPGRPLADPGPERVTLPGATPLNASNSLLRERLRVVPRFRARRRIDRRRHLGAGDVQCGRGRTYVVQLVATNGSLRSAPAQIRIVVNPALSPAPSGRALLAHQDGDPGQLRDMPQPDGHPAAPARLLVRHGPATATARSTRPMSFGCTRM
jgi:hypothetical protein